MNDWQVNAIVLFRSGNLVTPTLPFDNANTGSRGTFQRPNIVGDIGGPQTRQEWFNKNAFVTPPRFTFGNEGRNIIEGPGFGAVDFAMYKNLAIDDRHSTQLRFEFFNIMNQTSLNTPGTSFGTSSFGVIGGSAPARQIQFGFKYLF